MGIRLRLSAGIALALSAPLLLGATGEAGEAPGEGVLCLGGYIYMTDLVGRTCHPGKDAEFQSRIAGYAERLDDYIGRNAGGEAALASFKANERLSLADRPTLCESRGTLIIYDTMLAGNQTELASVVDRALARDGTPTYSDCS